MSEMEEVTMKQAPARLPELTKRCAYGGESFLLTNSGKPVAVLSPVGGPENHETLNDGAGSAAGQVGARPASNGRATKGFTARSQPNRKRGTPSK